MVITLAVVTACEQASGIEKLNFMELVTNNESRVDRVVRKFWSINIDQEGAVLLLLAEHTLSPGSLDYVSVVSDVRVLPYQR